MTDLESLRAVLDAAPTTLFVTDEAGEIVHRNAAAGDSAAAAAAIAAASDGMATSAQGTADSVGGIRSAAGSLADRAARPRQLLADL